MKLENKKILEEKKNICRGLVKKDIIVQIILNEKLYYLVKVDHCELYYHFYDEDDKDFYCDLHENKKTNNMLFFKYENSYTSPRNRVDLCCGEDGNQISILLRSGSYKFGVNNYVTFNGPSIIANEILREAFQNQIKPENIKYKFVCNKGNNSESMCFNLYRDNLSFSSQELYKIGSIFKMLGFSTKNKKVSLSIHDISSVRELNIRTSENSFSIKI